MAEPFTKAERAEKVERVGRSIGMLTVALREDYYRYEATIVAVEAERDALQAELDFRKENDYPHG